MDKNKEEELIVCPVGYHKNGECRCDEKVSIVP